jgi:hypothetical protein
MSSQNLFAFGAVVFIATSLGTLMYGYTVLRRKFNIALSNQDTRPALYVRTDQ